MTKLKCVPSAGKVNAGREKKATRELANTAPNVENCYHVLKARIGDHLESRMGELVTVQ